MAPWALLENSQPAQRVFERPLSGNESGFYWDSIFNGTADIVLSTTIECFDLGLDANKVKETWLNVKQKYPILSASVREHVPADGPLTFIVREDRCDTIGPDEFEMVTVGSDEEFRAIGQRILNGSRCLSNDLLCRIVFVKRADMTNKFHFVFNFAHMITDGMANASLLKDFMNSLASNKRSQYDLEQRLALATTDEDNLPLLKLPVARQRWHRAIGAVIFSIRQPIYSRGHTIPRRFTSDTPSTPAKSCHITSSFSLADTTSMLQTCRRHGLTFGNTFTVLGQVALARVLARRYVRGELSKQEWEWRRREPMYTGGPLNLRPFLDKDWYNAGGATNVVLCIQFMHYPLLYMPLGNCTNLTPGDEVPSDLDLLSAKRFFYRSHLLRKEADKFLRHPRFLEIAMAILPARLDRVRSNALKWRDGPKMPIQGSPIAPQDAPGAGIGGSSFGNVDKMRPHLYPISDTASPKIVLQESGELLHCRPTELYLGSRTQFGQMSVFVFYDGNVYDKDVVEEWLDEVRGAIKCYLIEEKETVPNKL